MDPVTLVMTCVMAPLVAFFLALVVFRRAPGAAMGVVLLAGAASMVASLLLLAGGPLEAPITASWLRTELGDVRFGFLCDAPSLLMGAVVGVIAFLVELYSIGYMARDPSKARFFALLGFFSFAMLAFVYASSLLMGFVFWELVGLASFLLIGFWYEKPDAVAAARKAFLMTRVGDVGLFIGLLLLFDASGTLDVVALTAPESVAALDAIEGGGRLELITLLMFAGIVGKSAQVPLFTWLPDAMEGPTPVSSLLHSATMVAAGVFLFARFHPLFLAAETTLTVVLVVATLTAFAASTMALVARDMKRVLAYSSISQLGFMLMALGAGSLWAGMFHLTTHAIFKCLLFLTSGAFIHWAHSQDLEEIGRSGARAMKIPTLGLVAGGLALAGIPPAAGFFSKEAVLHEQGGLFLLGGLAAAFLTAYYTFRMIFLVLRPASIERPEPAEGPTPTMSLPMGLLAIGALGAGLFGDALGQLLGAAVEHPPLAEMLPAIAVALSGAALAFWDFGRAGSSRRGFAERIPALHRFLSEGWYFDRFYDRFLVAPTVALARALYGAETKGFDGSGDGVGASILASGRATARSMAGPVQLYLATTVLVAATLALYALTR